jgi:hypothetical protein
MPQGLLRSWDTGLTLRVIVSSLTRCLHSEASLELMVKVILTLAVYREPM